MSNYLLKVEHVYRVPTVQDVLQLREDLENAKYGELTSFSYSTKEVKEKGQVVDEYQLVKAKIKFTEEKEPLDIIEPSYEMRF